MEENEKGIFKEVVLLDDKGQEVHFDHLMTFDHEGERYIALLPLDDIDLEEGEVVILRVVQENGEDVYRTIESEVLLEEVFDTFMDLFDEMIDEED
jgi:uncharacterized protein YrzB (UPF0473 family)